MGSSLFAINCGSIYAVSHSIALQMAVIYRPEYFRSCLLGAPSKAVTSKLAERVCTLTSEGNVCSSRFLSRTLLSTLRRFRSTYRNSTYIRRPRCIQDSERAYSWEVETDFTQADQRNLGTIHESLHPRLTISRNYSTGSCSD